MEDLLKVAKELLEDFDMYGAPVRLDVIAKLRHAVEAAQQSAQADTAKPPLTEDAIQILEKCFPHVRDQ